MDRQLLVLAAGVAGMLGGAWMIAPWMFGLMLMLAGVATVVVVLLADTGPRQAAAERPRVPSVSDVLARVRDAA